MFTTKHIIVWGFKYNGCAQYVNIDQDSTAAINQYINGEQSFFENLRVHGKTSIIR